MIIIVYTKHQIHLDRNPTACGKGAKMNIMSHWHHKTSFPNIYKVRLICLRNLSRSHRPRQTADFLLTLSKRHSAQGVIMMNISCTHHLLHLADPGHHHVLAGHTAHPGQLLLVLLTNERQSLRGGGGHASPQRLSDIVGQVPIPSVWRVNAFSRNHLFVDLPCTENSNFLWQILLRTAYCLQLLGSEPLLISVEDA